MNQFITIKQAAILTGKAEITIRRLIKRLSNQNNPNSQQMITQKKTSSGYQYQIDKTFLLKELKMDFLMSTQTTDRKNTLANQAAIHVSNPDNSRKKKTAKITKKEPDQTTTHAKKERSDDTLKMLKETIGILRDQLKVKDDQLRDKHDENQELIRGNREAVATINLMSKNLFLSEGIDSESGTEPVPNETIAEEPPKKKKRLLNFFK